MYQIKVDDLPFADVASEETKLEEVVRAYFKQNNNAYTEGSDLFNVVFRTQEGEYLFDVDRDSYWDYAPDNTRYLVCLFHFNMGKLHP